MTPTSPNIGDDLVARSVPSADSNGRPFDETKVERAAMLLVDLHPLLDFEGARNAVLRAGRPSNAPSQAAEITRLRAALAERDEALREAIGALEADDLDQQICCHGHECGCQGATHRQLVLHNLRRSKGAGK